MLLHTFYVYLLLLSPLISMAATDMKKNGNKLRLFKYSPHLIKSLEHSINKN